jgi:hypothetical protein
MKYLKLSTNLSSFHCKPLDFSQLFHKIHMSQHKIRLFQEKLDHTMQFSAFLHRIPVRLSAERASVGRQSQITINYADLYGVPPNKDEDVVPADLAGGPYARRVGATDGVQPAREIVKERGYLRGCDSSL